MKIRLCAKCAEAFKEAYVITYTGVAGRHKCGHCGEQKHTMEYVAVKKPKSCLYLREGRCALGGGCMGERCEAYRGHEEGGSNDQDRH